MRRVTFYQPPQLTVLAVYDALHLVGAPVGTVVITEWTELERLMAYDWATREYLAGGGSNSQWIRRRPKPSFLPDG